MDLGVLGDLNWLAVIVAAVAYFAVGAIYYTALSRPYQAATGMDDTSARGNVSMYVWTFVAYVLLSATLALIARHLGLTSVGDGIKLGLVVAIGFVIATVTTSVIYSTAPRKGSLWLINSINALIGVTVAAVIVTVWE